MDNKEAILRIRDHIAVHHIGEGCHIKIFEALGMAVEALEERKWIPCSERLPQEDGWYLVYAPEYCGKNRVTGRSGIAYSKFENKYRVRWGIERGAYAFEGLVTHWMALPKPPKLP